MHPTAIPQVPVPPTDPAPHLEFAEAEWLRSVGRRAEKVLPGPVGEYLSRELHSWAQIGLRFDQQGLTARLAAAVMAMPLPEPPGAAALRKAA